MGCAFACSSLSIIFRYTNSEKSFRLAENAAKEHERDGFNCLSVCLRFGLGCKKDVTLSKANSLIAAELGSVEAACEYSVHFVVEPVCWIWRTRGAWNNSPFLFLNSFAKSVEQFFSGSGDATVVFLIGRGLKGNIDFEKKTIFGQRVSLQYVGQDTRFDDWIGPANQAVSFYDSQVESTRLAVDTWTLVGMRNGVVKDIRKVIGLMIWEARFEAKYKTFTFRLKNL